MSVEKIVINLEGIVAESYINGIQRIEQMNSEPQEDEDKITNIFEKYNLNEIINYEFDPKIVRALKNDREQLVNYLDICRRGENSKHRADIPEDTPNIIYNLKGLRDRFTDITDKELRLKKQLEIFKQAKRMQELLRGKVDLHMNWMDKAYFTIQEFLQRNQKHVLALNPATENRSNKWVVDENIIEATNEVSKQFGNRETTEGQIRESDGDRSVGE